jgi:cytochrome c oxidase subunit II
MPRRRRLLPLALVVPLLLLASACASDAPQDTLEPKGPIARLIDDLAMPVFGVAAVVFVLVEFGTLALVLKFRAKKDDDPDELPAQTHGNTKLELGWTILPAIILGFVAVGTVATLINIDGRDDAALTVQVEGQQWWWRYNYDTDCDGEFDDVSTGTDLVIPAGVDVELRINSNDVIHSYWIPALNGKKDAVPNRTTNLTLHADDPGTYAGQRTEFCGLSHAYMRMAVRALSEADFASWLEDQKAPAALPADEAARRGLETFVSQCSSCHQIGGVNGHDCAPMPEDATIDDPDYDPAVNCLPGVSQGWNGAAQVSGTAPNLTHLMSRTRFIGGLYDLYLEDGTTPAVNTMASWIRNPEDFKPMAPNPAGGNTYGRGMPTLPLTET